MSAQPLGRRRILVTRARHQAGQLSNALRALGAEVIEIPAIEIAPPESYDALDRALADLSQYQWLILTSANAVAALRERMNVLGIAPERIANVQIASVGSGTAQALRGMGLEPSMTPPEYVAESLVETLGDRVRGQRVLLARAAIARDVIPDALRAIGATVEVVDAYRTVIPADSVAAIRTLLQPAQPPLDAVTFTSSSTVTNFLALLREASVTLPSGIRAVSIGPITSRTLRENALNPAAEAAPHDLSGLVRAVLCALGQIV